MSTKHQLTSSISEKIISNASVNDWNLDMILTHDSPCVRHLVKHFFETFKGFRFKTSWSYSNMTCLIELYVKVF